VDKGELQRRLMATFLDEVEGQVRMMNRDLLALENDPPELVPERVTSLFRSAHTLKGAARAVGVAPIHEACHALEDVLSKARDGKEPLGPDRVALLFRAADALQDAAVRLREGRSLDGAPIASILSALRGKPAPIVARAAPAPQKAETPVGRDRRGERVPVAIGKLDDLLASTQEALLARRRVGARRDEIGSLQDLARRVRIEWKRLGEARAFRPVRRREVVAAEALSEGLDRLERDLDRFARALGSDLRALDLVSNDVEEQVRRVRMIPFTDAIEGLDRMVRDLATESGKRVRLEIHGADVEVGRLVLDVVRGALVQIVRNAVDHGIEPPEERAIAGKPETAVLRIAAQVRGPQVLVTVSDDGRGLDTTALREAARKRGLPAPADDARAAALVFEPGLSTSRVVTDVSGRGVGLDVVRTRVEAMHGAVRVWSAPGEGARFEMDLPITVVTLRTVLISAGGQSFGLPTAAVQRVIRVPFDATPSMPTASLAGILGLPEPPIAGPWRILVVLAGVAQEVGVYVDAAHSEQELVTRALGPRLRGVPMVTGASVLPTGRVALVLNAHEIVEAALAKPGSGPEARPAAPRRLIVADDSFTTRTLVCTLLSARGYDVTPAADGEEAWRLLQEKGADLVVADVEMPRLDGVGLVRNIRGSRRLGQVPVVLVTALDSEADRMRGLEAGASAYLTKGAFDQGELFDTIERLLP
jgi:two-component system chemotaxis sensor kinase CheA